MQPHVNAAAGPSSTPRKHKQPFISADNRPEQYDGVFRVVLISTGSVASIKMPDIVGFLSQDRGIALQIVATRSSLHFYSQESIDASIRMSPKTLVQNGHVKADGEAADVKAAEEIVDESVGVRVWTDADEWADWKKVGDPILHIELRRWADLVVVAPCSADTLAKIAGGLCDNLATSLLRALSPSTQTIICPAMNTHMYQHPLTVDHLGILQDKLGYMVLGPQGAGRLACGDEGPGKMTDWREIVSMIQDFGAMYRQRAVASHSKFQPPGKTVSNPFSSLPPPRPHFPPPRLLPSMASQSSNFFSAGKVGPSLPPGQLAKGTTAQDVGALKVTTTGDTLEHLNPGEAWASTQL